MKKRGGQKRPRTVSPAGRAYRWGIRVSTWVAGVRHGAPVHGVSACKDELVDDDGRIGDESVAFGLTETSSLKKQKCLARCVFDHRQYSGWRASVHACEGNTRVRLHWMICRFGFKNALKVVKDD